MQLSDEPAAVSMLGVSVRSLDRLIAAEPSLPVIHLGRRVLFHQDRLEAWALSR